MNPTFSVIFSDSVDSQIVEKLNDTLEKFLHDKDKNIISVTQSTCFDSSQEDVILTVVILYETLL
jgi:hypothetical protein